MMIRYFLLFVSVLTIALPGCIQQKSGGDSVDDKSSNNGIIGKLKKQNPNPKGERRVAGKEGLVGKLTGEVVNYDAAMKQFPTLRIVEKQGVGGDPLTAISSAYVSITSRYSIAAFRRNLQILVAIDEANGVGNGKYPTYDQYMDSKNKCKMELAALPRHQIYAYQEKEGRLVILEDPAVAP